MRSELLETEASCHLHCSNLHLLIYVRNYGLGVRAVRKNYALHIFLYSVHTLGKNSD